MVISDVGAIRDYVGPDCVVLIPPYDSRGMAEAAINLLDDPLERERMSAQYREQALSFSWINVMKELKTVYEEVN
jgi:glycosyltransferase involved in cell wall biosynthesis